MPKTHGMSKTDTYDIYCGIIKRTENSKSSGFKYWGGRGIKMCPRWRESFQSFLDDMGPRPSKKHTLDRINNNGNYEPGNCRWVTMKVQNNNSRHCNFITYKGKTKTISQWAEELKIHRTTLSARIVVNKWPIEKAFTRPVGRWVNGI